MSAFSERLRKGPALLLDGGLGTELLARGLEPGAPPELWNLERPDEVRSAHREYVLAGSEAVHANSFGGSPCRLAAFGLAGRAEELDRAAVRLARESGAAFVIGDVGPSGDWLSPVGRADPAAWSASFEAQGRALAAAGADLLHVETASDLREALVALEALRRASPELPVWVSLAFERKRRGFFTVMGDPLTGALRTVARAGADAVGANCGIASPDMRDLGECALAAGLGVPLVFQPNAGQPEPGGDGRPAYRQDPEAFAADMAALAERGAAAVGGCCGTDPRFIRALAARLGRTRASRGD